MKQIQQLAHDLHTLIFLKLMSSEQGCNLGSTMAGCVGMKSPNIKNALCRRPQESLAWMSARASSPRTAKFGAKDSPSSDYN